MRLRYGWPSLAPVVLSGSILMGALLAPACADSVHSPSALTTPPPDPPSWLGDAGLVVRAPVQRPLHTLCGMEAELPLQADPGAADRRRKSLDAALDLGGVMIRRDFLWNEMEPTRGTFDFSGYDRVVDDAQARGVRLLAELDYGAPWANAKSPPNDNDYPPTDPADYANFARAAASHFQGRLAGYEIWNEPNLGLRFWKPTLSGDPAAYAALLTDAHDAIRAVDPTTPILLAGTVFTPQIIDGAIDFLQAAYTARPDLATRFDIEGMHAYPSYPPQRAPELGELFDPPLEAKIQMHAWLLAQHGGGDKPIWITEIGWPVYGEVPEAEQARFLVRATILAAHAGASAIFWYDLRNGQHPESFPPEDAFGLMNYDDTPKPAYRALKALLTRVGERFATTEEAGLAGLPPDAHAVVFRGTAAGPRLVVAWTVDTPSASLQVGAGVTAFDQFGAPKPSQGSVVISPDVTYLEIP